jgi:hypothetical protein
MSPSRSVCEGSGDRWLKELGVGDDDGSGAKKHDVKSRRQADPRAAIR